MDSEEVLILGVEDSAECLCLGPKRKDRGKNAADPGKKQFKKTCRARKAPDNCLVILDGGSGSEADYIEVYGEKNDKDCLAHVDSAADDKDVLECVVNGPKVLTLTTLQGDSILHDEPTASREAGKRDEVREKVTKRPPISLSSSGLTKTDPNPATILPDSTNSHLLVTDHLPTSWPTHAAPKVTKSKPDKTDASDRPKSSSNLGSQLHRTPTCWTNCPNCPPNKKVKYHLIDVAYNCPEWGVVSTPLSQAGFTVNRVQRIQNESLWERLCYEKQLLLRDRPDVNEQLLYHTSHSSIPVICEEGLDLRLSRNGMFGSGIYFSDSPVKCNNYWGGGVSGGVSATRYMFCCRVLLGEIKSYPKGRSEQLKREPPKPNPKPGELKFYDSVMGNLSGQNEFVVYNAYRVMPEYVLRYSLSLPVPATTPLSHPSMYNLSIQMARGMAAGMTGAMVGQGTTRKRGKKNIGARKN